MDIDLNSMRIAVWGWGGIIHRGLLLAWCWLGGSERVGQDMIDTGRKRKRKRLYKWEVISRLIVDVRYFHILLRYIQFLPHLTRTLQGCLLFCPALIRCFGTCFFPLRSAVTSLVTFCRESQYHSLVIVLIVWLKRRMPEEDNESWAASMKEQTMK